MRTTGYRVMLPDITGPRTASGNYHTISHRFSKREKSLAQTWYEQESAYLVAQKAKGARYVPRAKRQEEQSERSLTFTQYARQWLDNYMSPKTGLRLRPNSMRALAARVRHLTDFFSKIKGDELLTDITTQDCRDCSDWLGYTARIGRTATANAMRTLKRILKNAATPTDDRPAIISRNPCEYVTMPRFPKSRQAEIPAATPRELEEIYEAMPDYSRIAVYLGALCGLRIEEVCALQVQDVELDAVDAHGRPSPRIYVRHGLTRGEGDRGSFRLAPPKNEASESYSIIASARLIAMLREQIRRFTDGRPESMLIKPGRSHIMSPTTLRQQFDEARQATGRTGRNVLHFHTLRATHDNQYAAHAANEQVALRGTRRAEMSTYVARYMRTTEDDVTDAQRKTQDYLLPPDESPQALREQIRQREQQIRKLSKEVASLKKRLQEITKDKQNSLDTPAIQTHSNVNIL